MILALAFGVTTAYAQDLTSKKGEPYLPEEGDWAIGFNADPFITYAGNLFNGGTNTSPGITDPMGNLVITGKMFKDATTAYRVMLRIGMGSSTWNNFVMQDGQTDPNITVNDSWKNSGRNIVIGGGLEMRRGKTRLQGYYGGMLWIMMTGGGDEYTYGNAFSTTNTSPTVTLTWAPITSGPAIGSSRTTSTTAGSGFGFGLRGFIGAEYFILPKISIGAEYGWGVGMMNTGEGETVTESWDFANNTIKTTTSKTAGSKMFGLDTDINMNNAMMSNGSVNITFHF